MDLSKCDVAVGYTNLVKRHWAGMNPEGKEGKAGELILFEVADLSTGPA